MKRRPWRVAFTPTAESHATVADEWWRQHRQAAPRLLVQEIAAAVARLARRPRCGAPYEGITGGLRRILLRRVGYHLYYRCEPERRLVIVHGLWHASRTVPPAF